MMKTESFKKTGSYHKSKGEACQDVVRCAEYGTLFAAAAADGVSACRLGGTGALLACQAALDFARCEGDNVFTYSAQKLAFLLMEHVMYFLEREANTNNQPLSEYASTLSAAYISEKTGETRLVNLGDGAIFTVRDDTIYLESAPIQFRGQPCSTATKDAYRFFDVRSSVLQNEDALLLCSDGFLHAMKTLAQSGKTLEDAIHAHTVSDFKTALRQCREPDDISYIYVTYTTQ